MHILVVDTIHAEQKFPAIFYLRDILLTALMSTETKGASRLQRPWDAGMI